VKIGLAADWVPEVIAQCTYVRAQSKPRATDLSFEWPPEVMSPPVTVPQTAESHSVSSDWAPDYSITRLPQGYQRGKSRVANPPQSTDWPPEAVPSINCKKKHFCWNSIPNPEKLVRVPVPVSAWAATTEDGLVGGYAGSLPEHWAPRCAVQKNHTRAVSQWAEQPPGTYHKPLQRETSYRPTDC